MTGMDILQQANDVRALIEASRNTIAEGRFVDISEVEQKMALLFDTVSENPEVCRDINVGKMAGSFASLMAELDCLETDLDQQHQSLSGENKISPDSAAAAYQS